MYFTTDFTPSGIDLSAHLVTRTVPKDNPVLRVLFHATAAAATATRRTDKAQTTVCVELTAKSKDRTVSTVCTG